MAIYLEGRGEIHEGMIVGTHSKWQLIRAKTAQQKEIRSLQDLDSSSPY
jgi:hypothetical protein